ncbi:MAG TPA: MBL fold metallo-hydrolase [Rhizomicrobium sp.]|jgi:glyoxylase-like metal-dependent hydrolase (beta-lactamase superfamily II)|nr:MBL fold metallo-hydrolase [Rhizomicrobium sp.]
MSEPPLKVAVIPVTPYQQNCSLVWCTKTMRGTFVDPGGETDKLKEIARLQGITIEKILLTHGHLDHASGAAKLAREFGVQVEGPHRDDLFLLDDLGRNAKRPGFGDAENCLPDRWLEDNDTVTVGDVTLGVRHCPGHTPGHVIFYHQGVKIAFVGDVLFRGSIGRCDLPRGDWNQLISAIRERVLPLGDDITFVSGHGDMSTFGWERKTNPYVSDIAVGVTDELRS